MVEVLDILGHKNATHLDVKKLDAFLIKAIDNKFDLGTTDDSDILLMAFGLLRGYHYSELKSISERRAKYLQESDYLHSEPIAYNNADPEMQKTYRDRLRESV